MQQEKNTPQRLPPPNLAFTAISGDAVPDDLLEKCAKLFSSHYGVWNDQASSISPFLKAGQHVKLNSKKLRAQSLSPPTSSVLVTCIKPDSDELIGHAFATVWNYDDGGIVGWITQLVVHTSHRRLYIATHLLQTLKSHPLFQTITAIGLASSHPASVAALAKYNDVTKKVHEINTPFIASTAPKILSSTPINYLKDVKPLGSLFSPTPEPNSTLAGVVSAVDTQFFVDHKEPLEVLQAFKDQKDGGWCLGELLEGYEFLVVVPVLSS